MSGGPAKKCWKAEQGCTVGLERRSKRVFRGGIERALWFGEELWSEREELRVRIGVSGLGVVLAFSEAEHLQRRGSLWWGRGGGTDEFVLNTGIWDLSVQCPKRQAIPVDEK